LKSSYFNLYPMFLFNFIGETSEIISMRLAIRHKPSETLEIISMRLAIRHLLE
jgi:hypothetical protein